MALSVCLPNAVSPLFSSVCTSTAAFTSPQKECSSASFPDGLEARCLPFKFQSAAWSKVNVGVGVAGGAGEGAVN